MYKTIYKGFDMEQFNHLREKLESNNIDYKYHVKDPGARWFDLLLFAPARAITGSSTPANQSKEYTLTISDKYVEKAKECGIVFE